MLTRVFSNKAFCRSFTSNTFLVTFSMNSCKMVFLISKLWNLHWSCLEPCFFEKYWSVLMTTSLRYVSDGHFILLIAPSHILWWKNVLLESFSHGPFLSSSSRPLIQFIFLNRSTNVWTRFSKWGRNFTRGKAVITIVIYAISKLWYQLRQI